MRQGGAGDHIEAEGLKTGSAELFPDPGVEEGRKLGNKQRAPAHCPPRFRPDRVDTQQQVAVPQDFLPAAYRSMGSIGTVVKISPGTGTGLDQDFDAQLF
ncbi:MAG: hypothetical protein RL386_286 [Bacteroidota bacterium]